ncbi:DNA cytosine methyltransferase [Brevibacillus sp. 179-C9.3 HS]|uniref:DNA cytosine methyltransferase n=1 Tax=unclassified Brevibacillus TaxID=2684853 RepID=UPI0039A0BEDD
MSQQPKRFTACSLFSGGGLLDFSFKDHFDFIWANELNPSAAMCYQANVGDHMVVGDINSLDIESIPEADVFLGGPPCTDFSTDGANKGEAGDAGRLIWPYFDVIRNKKPKAILFENVSGLKKRHKKTLDKLVLAFEEIGYRVTLEELDAADFGCPSYRSRVFLVGIRSDLGYSFTFPKPTDQRSSVRDAIGDLPLPCEVSMSDRILGTVPNHLVTWTSPSPERIREILSRPNPNQWYTMRRLDWDRPSHTLVAHIAKDGREFLHPSLDRKITVREMLRLMGMPDSFVIPKDIKITQQYRLVGNGVAYPVGKALAEALHSQLQGNAKNPEIRIEQLQFDFAC